MENKEDRKQMSDQMKKAQSKYQGRLIDETSNPCLKEQELTYKCMNDSAYDKDKCQIYFENYKNCKSFWLSVQLDRRRKQITPTLPPPEEREKIKAEFLKSSSR